MYWDDNGQERGEKVMEDIFWDHVRRYILYFDIYLEYLDDNGQEKRGLCCGRNSVRPRETIHFLSWDSFRP